MDISNQYPLHTLEAVSQAQKAAGGEESGSNKTQSKGGLASGLPGAQPKFKDLWNQIQAKYGEKPKEPRVIKKQLDKDDFLKIMVTQMKHQDPTKPFDAEKLAAEIAQITGVEQLQNVNHNLEKMANAGRPMEKLAMAGLIGSNLLIDRNRFTLGKNEAIPLSFNLNEPADKVKVSIVSADSGEEVYTRDLGAQDSGVISWTWEGKNKSNLSSKPGLYVMKVEAVSESGKPINVDLRRAAQVIGVGFEGAEPVFLVGNGKNPEKVGMNQIVRIIGQNEGAQAVSVTTVPPAPSRTSQMEVPLPEQKPTGQINFENIPVTFGGQG